MWLGASETEERVAVNIDRVLATNGALNGGAVPPVNILGE